MDRIFELARDEGCFLCFGNLKIYPQLHQDDIKITMVNNIADNKVNVMMEEFQKMKRLKFGHQKSQVMNYGRKENSNTNFTLNNQKMINTNEYRYLGDILNSKGNYNDLVKERRTAYI